MSGREELDLSGQWAGIYNYPALLPPNNFEASLRDVDGLLTGLISEPDAERGGTLHAVIEGRREGSAVTFTKIYDELEPEPVVIFYSGSVEPGGDEIQGRWERPDLWSGTFLMVRNPAAEEEALLEASEEL